MKFYKGVLRKDLEVSSYVPGTVTTDIKVAYEWKLRIESAKRKGAAKHVRHGESVVIEISYDGELADCSHFQESGVKEHHRTNCWTSLAKDKAQINSLVSFKILSVSEAEKLLFRF